MAHDQDRARSLLDFVEGLSDQMSVTAGSWAEWSSWLTTFCDVYLGRPSDRDPWPTEEEESLTAIRTAAERLAVLDRLGAPPDSAAFRQAVEVELESLAPQTSRFGTGVFVGPVRLLTGLDFDTVFVLGMVDGAFPARVSDDPLLPDVERSAAGPDVPLRGRRAHDDRRDYLASLAAAPSRSSPMHAATSAAVASNGRPAGCSTRSASSRAPSGDCSAAT